MNTKALISAAIILTSLVGGCTVTGQAQPEPQTATTTSYNSYRSPDDMYLAEIPVRYAVIPREAIAVGHSVCAALDAGVPWTKVTAGESLPGGRADATALAEAATRAYCPKHERLSR